MRLRKYITERVNILEAANMRSWNLFYLKVKIGKISIIKLKNLDWSTDFFWMNIWRLIHQKFLVLNRIEVIYFYILFYKFIYFYTV